ncbi:MAG: XTP/dITP diphosphatase [Halobacteria archaeon]
MPGRQRLAFLTSNRHKFLEARAALGPEVALEQIAVPKPELQADDLETIARFGAGFAARVLGRPVVVEDTGLFVDALRGFPGPYSNYVFRTIGNAGVLRLLDGAKNRKALFRSVVAFAVPGGEPATFAGEVRGRIGLAPRGKGGFGYDPVFIYKGRTLAEMSVREKGAVSHRGRAFRRFGTWWTVAGRRRGATLPSPFRDSATV